MNPPLFTIHFEENPLRGVCCEKGLDFSRAADVICKMKCGFRCACEMRLLVYVCGVCCTAPMQ